MRRFAGVAAALAIAIAVGCSSADPICQPAPTIGFRIDSSMDAPRADLARAAMVEWSEATSADVHEDSAATRAIRLLPKGDPSMPPGDWGEYDYATGDVNILDVGAPDTYYERLLHEIGHALGVGHLTWNHPSGTLGAPVMSSFMPWPLPAHLTTADVDAYRSVHCQN